MKRKVPHDVFIDSSSTSPVSRLTMSAPLAVTLVLQRFRDLRLVSSPMFTRAASVMFRVPKSTYSSLWNARCASAITPSSVNSKHPVSFKAVSSGRSLSGPMTAAVTLVYCRWRVLSLARLLTLVPRASVTLVPPRWRDSSSVSLKRKGRPLSPNSVLETWDRKAKRETGSGDQSPRANKNDRRLTI